MFYNRSNPQIRATLKIPRKKASERSTKIGRSNMKITGLDKLSKQLDDAQKALQGLDGELGRVSFDPSDPGSIEVAIKQAESIIDERAGRYASNPIIAPLIDGMKQHFRSGILERAATARLAKGSE
jgi:hypothetical protein